MALVNVLLSYDNVFDLWLSNGENISRRLKDSDLLHFNKLGEDELFPPISISDSPGLL